MSEKSHVLKAIMNRDFPSIVKAEGIYLYDSDGKRYIDSSGGPMLCSLGHGSKEMAAAIKKQAETVSYVFRLHFTTPQLEQTCRKICETTNWEMDKVFLMSGGSEATEIAIKLARKYHIDNKSPSKFKIISRWLSYHGITTGALTLSGYPFRRAEHVPYLHGDVHIPPAYCYRCWFKQEPETCDLACAEALETEIRCQGPDTVAGFIAEPVSGMSICGAAPREDYFKRIRQICDKYDVLLMMDEVMTGVGRTGKLFGYEHFDTVPDIMTLGKGLSGGYFPLGAVVARARVTDVIEQNSGLFPSGCTWAGNPIAAVVAGKTIDMIKEKNLVQRADQMGQYLGRKLELLRTHPSVGDVRGKGMMRGVEFVKNKETKEPIEPEKFFWLQLHDEAKKHGLVFDTSNGCDRGQAGDMMMIGPPFIVTEKQIDEIVGIVDDVITVLEKRNGI